ncbi:unnamed protein product [Prorocentrum cordatum]|uniref:Uncharacterized protein n=1 Tax=Prorocentrum cordatum TaxID=2364126 RepID=A0ABN9V4L2_9DINO|nr:unnamed protein product [Polarella glacialis]
MAAKVRVGNEPFHQSCDRSLNYVSNCTFPCSLRTQLGHSSGKRVVFAECFSIHPASRSLSTAARTAPPEGSAPRWQRGELSTSSRWQSAALGAVGLARGRESHAFFFQATVMVFI